jgi:hypothetical protein
VAKVLTPALYPPAARAQNIEGEVRVRRHLDGTLSAEDGPGPLREAALDNVRSWVWPDRQSTDTSIVYRYRLLPGDCLGNDGPVVTMRPPFEVDVAMKRLVPCAR